MISECYNEDCLIGMARYSDKYFDLAITDPPYNVGRVYNKYDDNKDGEEYKIWCKSWFNELYRVSKTVVLTVGYKNLCDWMELKPKHIMIWHKPNQNSPSPLGGYNVYEPILFWGKLQKRIGHDLIKTNIAMQPKAAWHDCPKHLESWTKIIDLIIDAPGKIIDPFLGSGTTRIAANKLGFDFWGFEIDEKYFEFGNKRFENHKKQLTIFQ